jgi:hypothetical protein
VINSWSERSVPAGTPNARSLVTGKAERGTVAGELLDFLLQYKSFGLSFTPCSWRRSAKWRRRAAAAPAAGRAWPISRRWRSC